MNRPGDWAPLRDADPVGGDPVALAQLARRYAATAVAIEAAATGLRAVHDSTTQWLSAAGRHFRDQAAATAGELAQTRYRYDATARVVAGYASVLEQIQVVADDALVRARRAQDDVDLAERRRRDAGAAAVALASATGASLDQAAAERRYAEQAELARQRLARADRELEAAVDDWRVAGQRAADALDEITGSDGLTDRWAGALQHLEQGSALAGEASAYLGLAALALAPVPPAAAVVGTTALGVGLVAAAGTAVLYANDRATGRDVVWSTVGPVTNRTSRALYQPATRSAQAGRGASGGIGAAADVRTLARSRGDDRRRPDERTEGSAPDRPGVTSTP